MFKKNNKIKDSTATLVLAYCMGENMEKFCEKSTYKFSDVGWDTKLDKIENVFNLNLSIQALCLKLIHNFAFINLYVQEYKSVDYTEFLGEAVGKKKKYFTLSISSEDIIVDKIEGIQNNTPFFFMFDTMMYNLPFCFQEYVEEKCKINKYSELNRVVEFIDKYKDKYYDIDTSFIEFINDNKDLYQQYIDIIDKQ